MRARPSDAARASPRDARADLALLWPPPRSVEALGASRPPPRTLDVGPFAELAAAPETLAHAPTGTQLESAPPARADARVRREAGLAPATYVLEIAPDAVHIAAGDARGARSALATLAQLCRLAARAGDDTARAAGNAVIACARIDDAPDFATRGALLDVSRGRVPLAAELDEVARRLAAWKCDELQLYVEHTFAYAGHEEVWRDASPLTSADVRALDDRCASLGIELVPNQQSLGHMHRWLKHARYRDLAEVPEGVEHAFSREREPFTLCLADPRAIALLADLYDQLLPCFRSRWLDVGLDETFDLALGRSRAEAGRNGIEQVYLDRLRRVHALVAARGRRMQFWGDVILKRPELLPELPRDALALIWGYEAGHPFERELAACAASGLSFRVCPGTSSWQSFGGRAPNAFANLTEAARAGRKHGAAGWLVTDWGDRGHHQPRYVRDWGLFAAAGPAWRADVSLAAATLAPWLDAHLFEDQAGELGTAALELASAEQVAGLAGTNGSALFFLVAFAIDAEPYARTGAITHAGLEAARAHVARVRARLVRARSTRADAALVLAEMAWVADAIDLAAALGIARLDAGTAVPLGELPARARAGLAQRFADLEERHAACWLARDRPGGLSESLGWFERVRAALERRA